MVQFRFTRVCVFVWACFYYFILFRFIAIYLVGHEILSSLFSHLCSCSSMTPNQNLYIYHICSLTFSRCVFFVCLFVTQIYVIVMVDSFLSIDHNFPFLYLELKCKSERRKFQSRLVVLFVNNNNNSTGSRQKLFFSFYFI